jgi:hypothetical protein
MNLIIAPTAVQKWTAKGAKMELNREHIIKALECCGEYTHGTTCNNCPYMYIELADNEICSNRMSVDALALIKELTEENKAISERYAIQVVTAIELDKQVQKLTEENERLTEELAKSYESLDEQMNFYCSFTKSKIQNCPINDEIARAKADTVRKMQNELKKTFSAICKGEMGDLYRIMDQIAKEIMEENK